MATQNNNSTVISNKSSLRGGTTKQSVSIVPILRFKEFEDEWQSKLLGDISEFSKGKGISKSDIFEDGTLECIRYGELYTEYNEIISEIKSRTNLTSKEVVLSEVNDVIIPASGETQIDIATASCVMKAGIALGGDLNIIKSKANGIFLSYYLNSKKKIDIARLSQGISVVHLYSSQLKTLALNLPIQEEQQKIATFLTAIDSKLQQLNTKKTLLEQYKKGVMQQLFSQTLRFKDDDGSDYANWKKDEFGNLANRSKEQYNPSTDIKNYPCIELDCLGQDSGTLLNTYNSLEQKSIKNRFVKGDILFGKLRPYLKKFLKTSFDGVCSTEIWVLQGRLITNDYLYYLIQTYKFNYEVNITSGSKMPRAEWKYISSVTFKYPCNSEQQKIANYLSAIDSKIETVTQQIDKTQQFKKGLLQQMFV